MRPHTYQPDHENGPDVWGEYRCMCGMPKGNAVHERLPDKPKEDVSDRIIGEGEKE